MVSEADPCLFYSTVDGHKLIFALYGLIAAQNADDLDKFVLELSSEFRVTTLPAACFMGLQIKQLHDGSVTVSQERYTKKVLQKYNMYECNKNRTLVELCSHLVRR